MKEILDFIIKSNIREWISASKNNYVSSITERPFTLQIERKYFHLFVQTRMFASYTLNVDSL